MHRRHRREGDPKMFAFLRGTLHHKEPGAVVVDVGGVGYLVRIPLSSFYELGEPGEVVALRITTQVREDSISLYGFLSAGEHPGGSFGRFAVEAATARPRRHLLAELPVRLDRPVAL